LKSDKNANTYSRAPLNTDVARSGAEENQVERDGGNSVDNEPSLDVVDGDPPWIRHYLQRQPRRVLTPGESV